MQAKIIQCILNLIDSGFEPTTSAICGDCGEDVSRRLLKMARGGLVSHSRGLWYVTVPGEMYHEDAMSQPFDVQPHYRAWMDAVRTGMNPDGSESHITNPAVPSNMRPGFNDIENMFLRSIRSYNGDRRRNDNIKRIRKRYPKSG